MKKSGKQQLIGANPETLLQEFKDGCKYILCGIDVSVISTSIKNLSDTLKDIRSRKEQ